jgi:outer membrane protein assembly factor BamB
MRSLLKKIILTIAFSTIVVTILTCQTYEWRGPGRTGIYNETGLLKKWPDGGPKLVWDASNVGFGYGSAVVADDAIYITGRKDKEDVLTALTLDGKKKWDVIYGKAWTTNHDGSRCTPTVYNGNIFVISGSGDIACIDMNGKIRWTKNHFALFESKPLMFGISESPLTVDNIVVVSPGGKKAALAAFNINDGKVVWETVTNDTEPQYVSPKLIEYAGKKIIVTVLGTNIIGVDAKDGQLMWKVDYVASNAATGKVMKNHAGTPVYRDGNILIANGYNWVSMKLKLSADGNSVSKVWENRNFDPQLGGVVLLGNYIFGSTHMSQPVDSWACVDWTTGKTLWTDKWKGRGSIISADGMLIMFEERSGTVALANPNPSKLDIVSEFKITRGEGPFWAHPAIRNGKMYIRHGEVLMVYQIK